MGLSASLELHCGTLPISVTGKAVSLIAWTIQSLAVKIRVGTYYEESGVTLGPAEGAGAQ